MSVGTCWSEILFFRTKKGNFLCVFRHWAKHLWLVVENFRRRCENSILHDHRFILKQKLHRKVIRFLKFFGPWTKINLPFVQFFWRGYGNCFLRVHRNIFTTSILFEKVIKSFFHHFRTSSEKISAFCRQFWSRLWNLHSTCPREHLNGSFFCGKFLVFSHLRMLSEKFRPSGGFFSAGFWNCILGTHRKFIWKISPSEQF